LKKVFLLAFIMTLLFVGAAHASVVRLQVNGEYIKTDVPPQIINGRVMVPARYVSESLLATVNYNESTNTVIIEWPDMIKAGIGLINTMNENVAFRNEVMAVYNKYYGEQSTTSTEQSEHDNQQSLEGTIKGPLLLFADNKDKTYLGKLTTNSSDTDSIFNDYGTYGSKYNQNSIWNDYGTFGGKFSAYSPFNEFSATPPLIVDSNGNIVGRLTVNKFVQGAISPYTITGVLKDMGQ